MLFVNKQHYSNDVPLDSLIQNCQKASMSLLMDLFNLPVKKSARKAEFLHNTALAIQTCHKFWMQ